MTFASGARQFVVHDAFEMNLMLRRIVLLLVDAEHDRDVGALGRRRDHDPLGARGDVLRGGSRDP